MTDYEIDKISILQDKSNQEEARNLLNKIANQVYPILVSRKLKVFHLQEFYPKNHNLLGMNVNRGEKIMIRRK